MCRYADGPDDPRYACSCHEDEPDDDRSDDAADVYYDRWVEQQMAAKGETQCPTCPMVMNVADAPLHVCVGYDDHPEAWPDDDKRLRGTTVWPRPEEI